MAAKCKESNILPLLPSFALEVGHYMTLDETTRQTLNDHIKSNPFQLFSFNKDKIITDKSIQDESFLFWGDQLWFRKHQLSLPLFEVATKFMTLPTSEIDAILSKFFKDLQNFQQTFLTYKQKHLGLIEQVSINLWKKLPLSLQSQMCLTT